MKRLRKSNTDKVFFGVCGGIGRYFDVDPVLVRVAFVLLLFAGLTGLLVYIVLAIIMPEDEETAGSDPGALAGDASPAKRREALAAILIVGGAVILLANLGAFSWLRWSVIWPVILIAIGVAIIAQQYRRSS